MKPQKLLMSIALFLFVNVLVTVNKGYAQADTGSYHYIDLYTGQPIDIYYDTVQYITVNRATHSPVDFYVINNADTVHGVTGLVVNNMLIRTTDGKYILDPNKVRLTGDELDVRSMDVRKVDWQKNGVKIKDVNGVKQKTTGGKEKTKDEWGKYKWKNGEWKKVEPRKY